MDVTAAERRILIVDDDAGIRLLLARVLSRQGFVVDSARDGAEAIEKMMEHEYEVIALDLMMPRIDGVGVVKYLSEHNPEKLKHVLIMTAFGASAIEKVCPPVERFIEKPFDLNDFIAEAAECGDADLESVSGPPSPS